MISVTGRVHQCGISAKGKSTSVRPPPCVADGPSAHQAHGQLLFAQPLHHTRKEGVTLRARTLFHKVSHKSGDVRAGVALAPLEAYHLLGSRQHQAKVTVIAVPAAPLPLALYMCSTMMYAAVRSISWVAVPFTGSHGGTRMVYRAGRCASYQASTHGTGACMTGAFEIDWRKTWETLSLSALSTLLLVSYTKVMRGMEAYD